MDPKALRDFLADTARDVTRNGGDSDYERGFCAALRCVYTWVLTHEQGAPHGPEGHRPDQEAGREGGI